MPSPPPRLCGGFSLSPAEGERAGVRGPFVLPGLWFLCAENRLWRLAIHNALKAPALFAVVALALGSLRVCGQAASADPYEGLAKFKFGESRVPLATD